MQRTFRSAGLLAALVCVLPWASAQEGAKISVKTAEVAPPEELSAAVRQLLRRDAIQVVDRAGTPLASVWLRQSIPTDATIEQIKNGITYREVKQSELIGAIRFDADWRDYRKQKIKAGVYTLRLAFQPNDDKHTPEVSEFRDCIAMIAAKTDTAPDLIEPAKLRELSADSIGSNHPAVFMLVPTKAGNAPTAIARPKDHWAIGAKAPLTAAGKDTGTFLGIGINFVGHSPAE